MHHQPANVQATVQPVLDRLQESFLHIKQVASKPGPSILLSLFPHRLTLSTDVALSAKTTDILSYSKDQLSPLLNDAVGVVKTVIAAASAKATETKEAGEELAATAEKKTVETAQAAEKKTVETAQVVEKQVKEVGQKAKKAKVNGAAH